MILVFDVGTTAVKGALFNRNGVLAVKTSRSIRMPKSADPLVHEIDTVEWLNALKECSRELQNHHTGKISAVVVSGNGPTLVPVDDRGDALLPAMTWMDRRGITEAAIIQEKSGIYVDPTFYLPKILWLQRNRPDVYARCRWFLSCSEYLASRLTGEAAFVFPGEGLENFIWTEELIDILSLDKTKFPEFIMPGEKIGLVTAEAESVFGITRGTPVFGGGPDFIMALLGTATVLPGRACDRAGTSEGINICSLTKVKDTRLMCYRHVAREYWNITGIISTSGKALEWFKNVSCGEKESFDDIIQRAGRAVPGADKLIFLPYLTGERAPLWDTRARGVFIGLTLNHGLQEMTRAVMESIGFAIRDVLGVLEENGVTAEELRITGNPAKSDLWNQIKSDITGKQILVPEIDDAELVGDLCIALFGLSDYQSPGEAAENIVNMKKTFTPDNRHKEMYSELFQVYRDTYRGLKGTFEKLSNI